MFLEFIKASGLFFIFIAVIIGLGIFMVRVIDYIEENPYAAKEKLQTVLNVTMGLHVLFLLMRVPLWHILFSLSIQYVLNMLFASYPTIKAEDLRFVYGVVGSLVNHFLFIKFFVENSRNVLSVILSFIVIWISPFCFFFSMSASDDNVFAANSEKPNKTYAGMIVEWLMTVGKKSSGNKYN